MTGFAALLAAGCKDSESSDAAFIDGGATDASVILEDPADGATSGDADSGHRLDAAPPPKLMVTLPGDSANWRFLGPSMGGPNQVFGASYDEGGNLWVAGGEQGLYVLRVGAARFNQYTMADGLRPYGYMPDGSDPPGAKYLKVISVSGAWAGSAFVGYQGRLPGPGEFDCENNWDGPNPDPAIYKSGDADRVTLLPGGISVVHYDIFSGPGLTGAELHGREKLCDILRIRYDSLNQKVWFGGNHGFAMGEPRYAGNANCQWFKTVNPPTPTMRSDPFDNEYGHQGCNGLVEHVHPAINAYDKQGNCCAFATGGYYGVSVDPLTHDVWFGGQLRTTRFRFASTGHDYFAAESQTEDLPYVGNRIDIWPDAVQEPNIPRVQDRTDDFVSGAAAMSDGSVWVSSFYNGLAHIDGSGQVTERIGTAQGLVTDHLSAIVADPLDESIWVGTNFGPGVARMANASLRVYDATVFGTDLSNQGVTDLQSFGGGGSRRIVVSFSGDKTHAGAVAVYSGP